MSGALLRRIEAAEARTGAPMCPPVFRWQPDGLDDAELAAWWEAEVAPAVAAGAAVTIYQWSTAADLGAHS